MTRRTPTALRTPTARRAPRGATPWAAAALGLVVATLGCGTMIPDAPTSGASILRPATAAPDAVTLEIYWAPLPEGDAAWDASFWGSLQEDRLEAEARRGLAANGLRAGVAGAAMNDELLRLLNPTGGEGELTTSEPSVVQETGVWRRTRQARPGERIDLKASELIDEAPLLTTRGGELTGRTLSGAEATYVLTVDRSEDGRTLVRLTPEVRHGGAKQRFSPDETGMISYLALERDAEVFADLAIEAPLAAGETLVVGNLPDSGSRLGGYFHRSAGSGGGRRAILVRVAQAPAGDPFGTDG